MKSISLFSPILVALCLFSFSAQLHAQKKGKANVYDYVVELEQLYNIDKLPAYRDNAIIEQESSYDRTGGNEDGFAGTYSFVGKENGKLVIANLKGPGVINRIWTPTPTNDTIEFYFDGEKQPRLKLRFIDLFSGNAEPFVKPLCGNEIGGYYCYLPIPYQKSCKIMYTGKVMNFYQIQYRNLPNYKVDSYTGNFSAREKQALDIIKQKWQSVIKPNDAANTAHEKSFVLEPGGEYTFFQTDKGGRITGFEIDDNSYFQGQYKDVVLQATWDGEETPAINAPAADFFGYAFGKPSMRSLLMGKMGNLNYCYLPAPFDKKAEMKLIYHKRPGVEQPAILVKTKVYYAGEQREPAREGKLYTNWRREINPRNGEYYKFLSAEGKGHYVGTIHQAQGLRPEMTLFFEGDDSTYVDGKMRMHGTGSEDYYNGGWYALADRWDTGISLPIHGSLNYSLHFAQTGGYRFFLTDKLSYEKEFYQGIEHGPERNEYPVDYTSVAFYYANIPPTGIMQPQAHLRVVNTPSVFRFYPQLMKMVMLHETHLLNRGHNIISSEHEGGVKVFLDDIPEGRYKIYLSYHATPKSGSFAVWQRQNMIKDWQSAHSKDREFKQKVFIGETYFTPQNNTLTIKVKNDGGKKDFEFDCIFLEKK